jgi:hypothetical protein
MTSNLAERAVEKALERGNMMRSDWISDVAYAVAD